MDAGSTLKGARTRAALTQRELAARTGVAQPTIARIESGRADPRISTLDLLLSACGERLAVEFDRSPGIDRSQIHDLLRLTPRERVESLRGDAAGWDRFEAALTR
jgi:transcriptional regulator with XRE-family HTH domain